MSHRCLPRTWLSGGQWTLEFPAPWGDVTWAFALDQSEHTVEGEADVGGITFVLDGAISDETIDFTVEMVDGPHEFVLEFYGELDDAGAVGTVTFDDGSAAEWTMRRSGAVTR